MTQEEIDSLIGISKKVVTEPQRDFRLDGLTRRNGFTAKSTEGSHQFSVFLRQHSVFEENFSIGLVYHAPGGKRILLLRMNGPHGISKDNPFSDHEHYGYHIHQIKPEDIELENYSDPKFCEKTQNYDSFEAAILHFLRVTQIQDCTGFFPIFNKQLSLEFNAKRN